MEPGPFGPCPKAMATCVVWKWKNGLVLQTEDEVINFNQILLRRTFHRPLWQGWNQVDKRENSIILSTRILPSLVIKFNSLCQKCTSFWGMSKLNFFGEKLSKLTCLFQGPFLPRQVEFACQICMSRNFLVVWRKKRTVSKLVSYTA